MLSKRTVRVKKTAPKRKPLTRKDALSAVRSARKTGPRRKLPSKAWQKGGREYTRVLGHFGLAPQHEK